MYKINWSESSIYIFEISRSSYNLRSQRKLDITSVTSESYCKNVLKHFGPIIWNSIPARLKNTETLAKFKKKFVNGK